MTPGDLAPSAAVHPPINTPLHSVAADKSGDTTNALNVAQRALANNKRMKIDLQVVYHNNAVIYIYFTINFIIYNNHLNF